MHVILCMHVCVCRERKGHTSPLARKAMVRMAISNSTVLPKRMVLMGFVSTSASPSCSKVYVEKSNSTFSKGHVVNRMVLIGFLATAVAVVVVCVGVCCVVCVGVYV